MSTFSGPTIIQLICEKIYLGKIFVQTITLRIFHKKRNFTLSHMYYVKNSNTLAQISVFAKKMTYKRTICA